MDGWMDGTQSRDASPTTLTRTTTHVAAEEAGLVFWVLRGGQLVLRSQGLARVRGTPDGFGRDAEDRVRRVRVRWK